ncbi:hypothetical protein OG474_30165 [Kribbella sp. NBC_01505]|uniref:hypothetical protein n=1 Tax=Kribbella sp. NBC_01505 TaxID=2903580 RepID=UPI003864831C
MTAVIEETEEYRVRIEHDADPAEPYHDGGTPILRYGWNRQDRWAAVQLTSITSHVVDPSIVAALERLGRRDPATQEAVFERYLRVFHGSRSIVWCDHRGGRYVTFDTQAWRDEVELTDEWLAELTRGRAKPLDLADMDDYVAYLDGECYGWIVEKKTRWVKVDSTGTPIRLTDETLREDWEEVESCWGFFGWGHVEDEAREAFAALTEED